MKNLVGRKVKFNTHIENLSVLKEYKIVGQSYDNDTIIIIIYNYSPNSFHTSHLDNGNIELVVDEWVPKQGEKVLVSDDGFYWAEMIYLIEHEDMHICKSISSNKIVDTFIHVKPYKEEIKIGDWYMFKEDLGVFKVTEKHNLDEMKKYNYKKIIDKELIKKLEDL